MLMSNIILHNMNIMNMKRHMLICLFMTVLVGKERNEIVIKIRDIYYERSEIVLRIKDSY
jgi:hypothetical protein